MLSPYLLAPPAVFQLAPPYDRFAAVPDTDALAWGAPVSGEPDAGVPPPALADGAVLVVGLASPDDWDAAAALVPRLQARFPAAPVVVRVPGASAPAELGRRAAALHVRAVLGEDESPADRLRWRLTDDAGLEDEVAWWLTLRDPALPPAVVGLARDIVRLAPRYHEVAPLLAELGHAERTVRTWCGRAGMPGPGKWLAAAHAVRAALRLQTGRAPLLALAVEAGYSDHSSLSRQYVRLFGVRPGAIRRTLGWEWLLDRWLRRATG